MGSDVGTDPLASNSLWSGAACVPGSDGCSMRLNIAAHVQRDEGPCPAREQMRHSVMISICCWTGFADSCWTAAGQEAQAGCCAGPGEDQLPRQARGGPHHQEVLDRAAQGGEAQGERVLLPAQEAHPHLVRPHQGRQRHQAGSLPLLACTRELRADLACALVFAACSRIGSLSTASA